MPFVKANYPKDWKQIRDAIVERDGHRCKFCGLKNYTVGTRSAEGKFYRAGGNEWHDLAGNGEISPREFQEAKRISPESMTGMDDLPYIQIILTVAHLDHDTTNNDPSNLAALCQRCHLRYDAKHHAKNSAQTRLRKGGQLTIGES